ncbi:MAG TPA: glycosyltransferase family 2 protein [Candidatus Mediterraneibacter norfolkensis]|nr:glycosyltransferase family 2 protein [Candidatus Mediterraneibacter norfolkensis]
MNRKKSQAIAEDIEVVVTSFNQGAMILEAVHSIQEQTVLPARICIVDDGSTDETSLRLLKELEEEEKMAVPLTVLRQPNGGVSAARNTGIRAAKSPMVLVLDGDDRLESTFIEEVGSLLRETPELIAASSWMRTFGVLKAEIRPCGGDITHFLSRNCCPATHILRRRAWEQCGGYDESMRSGFEDWDFFLSMLETSPDVSIGIVEKPLIEYRTAPASSNVRSMTKRLDLMRFLIEKHKKAYLEHVADAVLGVEAVSMSRLYGWENEILRGMERGREVSLESVDFLEHPSYGDGGMAAAVRIASAKKRG